LFDAQYRAEGNAGRFCSTCANIDSFEATSAGRASKLIINNAANTRVSNLNHN
jgi:hypothetical protein